MGHSESLVCPRRQVKGCFSLMVSQRDDTSCHIQVATKTNHCKLWGGGGGEKNQILRSRCCREASHVDKEREEPACFLASVSWPSSSSKPPASSHDLCGIPDVIPPVFTHLHPKCPVPLSPFRKTPVVNIGSTQKDTPSSISICKVLCATVRER